FVIFFFQAEDGIRDRTVTGVQTCTLPIWTLATLPIKSRDEPPLTCVMIARQALWNCLRVNVPDSAIITKKVSAVVRKAGEQKNIIKFADGSADEECDLIIGADGLRSVVRRAIFS